MMHLDMMFLWNEWGWNVLRYFHFWVRVKPRRGPTDPSGTSQLLRRSYAAQTWGSSKTNLSLSSFTCTSFPLQRAEFFVVVVVFKVTRLKKENLTIIDVGAMPDYWIIRVELQPSFCLLIPMWHFTSLQLKQNKFWLGTRSTVLYSVTMLESFRQL